MSENSEGYDADVEAFESGESAGRPAQVVQLVPKGPTATDEVETMFLKAARLARENGYVAGALVVLDATGKSSVATLGRGNRVLLLGAVTDLMFSIARDGDD